ncbi:Calx-beta domain-containing protein, partial [Candidatus Venteria ishoeyi]|uniref:Calx-beta domain-containing protein n=1 Tax=Candidatus Venteria ishoeyi TaxID=1899563 RepID=UPI00255C9991
MQNAADYLLVEGDFVLDSSADQYGRLNDGVLEIKGNFTQKSTYPTTHLGDENFDTSENHKTILSGSGTQSVSFEDPSSGAGHFNILEISNPLTPGILFTTKTHVGRLLDHQGIPHVSLSQDYADTDFVDYDGDGVKDHLDPYPTVAADQPPGSIEFAVADYQAAESDGTVSLSVSRSGGSAGAASLQYVLLNSSATLDSDFSDGGAGTLDWPDGETGTKTITINLLDDAEQENAEDFRVYLANVTTAASGQNLTARVQISDNDAPAENLTQTTASVDGTKQTVSLEQTYTSPVIIAGVPSSNDAEPGSVRLSNVNTDSFDLRFQEWDYLDGVHATENLPWLALESGYYLQADGSIWEVG